MNSENKTKITQSKFIKLLKKNIKRVIAEQGIEAITRKGDKELDLLVKKIVKQPIQTEEDASKIGKQIGTEIVEISRQKGKTNLDKSVIRQLATQRQISLSKKVSSQKRVTPTPVAKTTPKTPTLVTQEPATITPVAETVVKLELGSSLDGFQHSTEILDLPVDLEEISATEDVEELEEDQLLPS